MANDRHQPLILPHHGITPTIAESAFIAPTATITGDTVIGDETSIWFGCVLRGDVDRIRIGARVNVQDGTIIHCSRDKYPTTIGDDVSIGHMALLHGCTLESGCFIGMSAVIMDDVVVESGAFVAAGALVTPHKRIKAGELWTGRPARLARAVGPDEREVMEYNIGNYVRLGREYREILGL